MTSKITKFATALVVSGTVIFAPVLSAAEGDQYFGLQYSSATFEFAGEDWEPTVLMARYGKFIGDNFAIEGRLGIGIDSDTLSITNDPDVGNASVEIDIDTLIGIYGVGSHDINKNSSIYALIGITNGEATFSAKSSILGNASFSETETDLSYGIGANIGISNTAGINLEYISYISKTDFDVTAVNFGFVFKF